MAVYGQGCHPQIIIWTEAKLICQTICYCISKTKNEFGQNPKENIILTGPGQYTKILMGSLTKANRDNMNVKYNILQYLPIIPI